MESRQIFWYVPECSKVLRTRSNGPFGGRRRIRRGTESSDETDEGADNATSHLDNVDYARAVGLCGLSRNVWVTLRVARHRRPVKRNHEIYYVVPNSRACMAIYLGGGKCSPTWPYYALHAY